MKTDKLKMLNKSPFKHGATGRYEIRNKVSDSENTEIYIYDEIGFFGIEAEAFVKDLKEISGDVTIRIMSPGGSVWQGLAISAAIRERKDKTDIVVDGIAASIASVIAVSGDSLRMSDGAFLMIHEPWTLMAGNATELRKEADLLDKIGDEIASIYAKKTGKSTDEIRDLINNETWLTAKESKELGFADEITEEATEQNKYDLSVYNNVPESLKQQTVASETPETCETPVKPRDAEKALRDAGFTRSESKKILAEGLKSISDGVKPTEPEPETPEVPEDVVIDTRDMQRHKDTISRTIQLLQSN